VPTLSTPQVISAEQWEAILRANCLALETAHKAAEHHCANCGWALETWNQTAHCALCTTLHNVIEESVFLTGLHVAWAQDLARKRAMLRGDDVR